MRFLPAAGFAASSFGRYDVISCTLFAGGDK
jgi:hypothetical protein